MAEPHAHDAFPDLFSSAAAWCDPSGVVVSCNAAFLAWARGPVLGSRVEIHGARGVLFGPGECARPLVMVPLADGGWLALAEVGESVGAMAAVATAVAYRLERVESALESNARIGLLEGPSEPVARCLRETLATTEEIRLLRRQVAAFGAGAAGPVPVCLRTLVRDARAALRHLPVTVDAPEGDYAVELDRGRFLPVLVALLEELAATVPGAGSLHVTLRGGEFVRIQLSAPSIPVGEPPALAAARRFLAGAGGRALLDPGVAVTLEVPAFGGGLAAAPSRAPSFGTVLIVDDDESALAMMGAVLSRLGFRVLAASDGVAASALLRQHLHEIVAVVADAVLPGRSGVELAAEARRSIPGLPVLLVSGHSSDLLGGDDLGHLPMLPKPFGARALAERVRALLELGQQRR